MKVYPVNKAEVEMSALKAFVEASMADWSSDHIAWKIISYTFETWVPMVATHFWLSILMLAVAWFPFCDKWHWTLIGIKSNWLCVIKSI